MHTLKYLKVKLNERRNDYKFVFTACFTTHTLHKVKSDEEVKGNCLLCAPSSCLCQWSQAWWIKSQASNLEFRLGWQALFHVGGRFYLSRMQHTYWTSIFIEIQQHHKTKCVCLRTMLQLHLLSQIDSFLCCSGQSAVINEQCFE